MLAPFFTADPADYLFSPAPAVEELHAGRAARRVTPRYAPHVAGNARRRAADPRRRPTARYEVTTHGHAVARASDRAFPPPEPLRKQAGESARRWGARLTAEEREAVKAWRKAHRWHPNQLRHAFATRVRREHRLEAAQVLLGHTRTDVTQVYAERNEGLAAALAAEIG